jgi:hypothetical protein
MIFRSLALRSGLIGLGGMIALSIVPASASSLVVNGDFSAGDTAFSSDYVSFTNPPSTGFIPGPGGYVVTPANNVFFSGGASDWTTVPTDPFGGNGNVLAADGSLNAGAKVWYQTVNGLSPNASYLFSFWGADVNTLPASNAAIQAYVNGTLVGTLDTTQGWLFASFLWTNSGSNTSAILSLVDANTGYGWNDFAVTDIALSQTPLPAALPLFASGLGVMDFLARRRKRKNAAAIAA